MRGSVIKEGRRWYVKIELDPDPATGRRRQAWHAAYSTRTIRAARVGLPSRLDGGQ